MKHKMSHKILSQVERDIAADRMIRKIQFRFSLKSNLKLPVVEVHGILLIGFPSKCFEIIYK